jgi:hypothetical protein
MLNNGLEARTPQHHHDHHPSSPITSTTTIIIIDHHHYHHHHHGHRHQQHHRLDPLDEYVGHCIVVALCFSVLLGCMLEYALKCVYHS